MSAARSRLPFISYSKLLLFYVRWMEGSGSYRTHNSEFTHRMTLNIMKMTQKIFIHHVRVEQRIMRDSHWVWSGLCTHLNGTRYGLIISRAAIGGRKELHFIMLSEHKSSNHYYIGDMTGSDVHADCGWSAAGMCPGMKWRMKCRSVSVWVYIGNQLELFEWTLFWRSSGVWYARTLMLISSFELEIWNV